MRKVLHVKWKSSILVLFALIFLQSVWHLGLWAKGFSALSTDEYLRLYFSASWANHPRLFIPGEFLPAYFYLYGSAIGLGENILWAGRGVTLLLSLTFLLTYFASVRRFFRSSTVALFSLGLVMFSPLYMRISTTPLSEIGALAFMFLSIFFFVRWKQKEASGVLDVNLGCVILGLLAGNLLRYESWVFSIVLLAFIWVEILRKHPTFWELLLGALCSMLPIGAIAGWLMIGQVYFSNPTKFIPKTPVDSLDEMFRYLLLYPKLILGLYPLLFGGILLMLGRFRRVFRKNDSRIFWGLSSVFFVFLAYVSLRYGRHHVILPERTLLFFVVFVSPLVASVLVEVWTFRKSRWKRGSLVLASVLCVVWSHWVFASLPKPPLPEAKRVGIFLKKTVKEHENVLVEKVGWDWSVIYVESNLMGQIFFDRRSLLGKRMTADESLIQLLSKKELREALVEGNVSYVVLKTPKLKKVFHQKFPTIKEIKKASFSIYEFGRRG